jgi:hypothetical protein
MVWVGVGAKALATEDFESLNPSASQVRILIHAVEINSSVQAEWFLRLLFSFAYQDLSFGLSCRISGLC